MGKIKNYKILSELTDDTVFIAETNEGTRKVPYSMFDIKAEEKINAKGINEAKNIANSALVNSQAALNAIDELRGNIGVVNENVIYKYGVCRDIPSHSPVLTRVDDAAGLVAEAAVGDEIVRNDFDKIYPWCDIKRCTLADDGTVTSYFGDPNYTEDGSIGQVMVEIPVYWKAHYFNESGTKEYTYVSREKADSRYFIPKRFIDKNGNVLEKIYIGAYRVTWDKDYRAESRAGKEDILSRNFDDIKSACSDRGKNWHPYDIWDYEVIKDLFTIEFATLDSQSVMSGTVRIIYEEPRAFWSSAEMWSKDDTSGLTETVTSFVGEGDEPQFAVGQEVCIYAADTDSATGEFDTIEGNNAIVRRRITAVEKIELQWVNPDGVTEYFPGCLYHFDGEPVKVYADVQVNRSLIRTGITNYINASSGELYGDDFKRPFRYRYMENIYCGYETTLFGALIKDGKYYVCENPAEYIKTVTDAYKQLGYSRPDETGFISELGCDNEYPYVCLPAETGGASDKDYCDNFKKESGRVNPENSYILQLGCGGTYDGGLFNIEADRLGYSQSRLCYCHYEKTV